MPLKTWSSGDVVNAAELNTTIEDAIKGVTYDLDAGETIDGTSDPVIVAVNPTDNELYKADASDLDYLSKNIAGFVLNSTTNGNEARLQTSAIVEFTSTFSLTVAGGGLIVPIYEGDSGSSTFTIDATTKHASVGFKTGANQSNISRIDVYILKSAPSGITAILDIYAMDTATGKPTGSNLGSSDSKSISGASSSETFTFTTEVDVDPDTEYCFVLRVTAITSGSISLGDTPNVGYTWIGKPTQVEYQSTDSGSSWSAVSGTETIIFEVYSNEDQYQYGDDLYLSETAGEITLVRPDITTSAVVKVGKLLTTSTVLIKEYEEILLGETAELNVSGGGVVATNARACFHAPHGATKCIIIFTDTQTFEFTLHKGDSYSFVNVAGNDITAYWTSGVVYIKPDSQYNENVTAKIRFYT